MKLLVRSYLAIISASVLLSSCAHDTDSTVDLDQETSHFSGSILRDQDPGRHTVYRSIYGEIPKDSNEHVDRWLTYFRGRGRPHMLRYLQRSTRYLSLMKEVLSEEGLPADLVYLPIIESGFSSSAHSIAGAVGYWQFVRGTASRYGLKINYFVDERRDPVLSTRAAADYFKSLYSLFGNWHLALASYNTGENRVKRIVMKKQSRDFWTVRKHLPKETRNYIPKFLAAVSIAKDPRAYGFVAINYKSKLSYDSVYVTSPVSLKKLARNMKVNFKELRSLNPRYRTDFVPIYRGRKSLVRVPKGHRSVALASIAKSRAKQPSWYAKGYDYYRVRSGDSLWSIARKYKISLARLKSANGMSRKSVLKIGKKLKIPRSRGRKLVRSVASRKAASSTRSTKRKLGLRPFLKSGRHRVKRGENLALIARKYKVGISQIKRWNKLRSGKIHPGQVLIVTAKPASSKLQIKAKPRKLSAKRSREAIQKHRVRRGESLPWIAQKYKLSLARLRKINKLKKGATLHPGQILVLRYPASSSVR